VNEIDVLKNALDRHMTEHTEQMKEQNSLFREILDRVIGVETHQKIMLQTCPTCQTELIKQGKDIVAIDASAKSAHHRIDGLFTAATALGGIAGWVANFVAEHWPKGGGHG